MTQAYEKAWVEGIAPSLSDAELLALAEGLEADTPQIMQGRTVYPLPWEGGRPVVCACPVAYACWFGFTGDLTVNELEARFAAVIDAANTRLGWSGATSVFLNWIDTTPRGEMVAELLRLTRSALASRRLAPSPALAS